VVERYFRKKPGFWPRIQPNKLKKPGFSQFFGGGTIFSEKTRFLATHHNSRNSRNRVFRSFSVVERYFRKKPGFWPRIQPNKLKKPGFLQFFGGGTIFSEKTRFLATHTTK